MPSNNQLSDADRTKYVAALAQKNNTASAVAMFTDRLAKAQTADTAAAAKVTAIYADLTTTYALGAHDVIDSKTGTITRG